MAVDKLIPFTVELPPIVRLYYDGFLRVGVAGGGGFLLFCGFMFLLIPWEEAPAVLVSCLGAIPAILLLWGFMQREFVELTESGIKKRTFRGDETSLAWNEIAHVDYNTSGGYLLVSDHLAQRKIKFSSGLTGFALIPILLLALAPHLWQLEGEHCFVKHRPRLDLVVGTFMVLVITLVVLLFLWAIHLILVMVAIPILLAIAFIACLELRKPLPTLTVTPLEVQFTRAKGTEVIPVAMINGVGIEPFYYQGTTSLKFLLQTHDKQTIYIPFGQDGGLLAFGMIAWLHFRDTKSHITVTWATHVV